MSARRRALTAAVALAGALAGLGACSLDFDRFDPTDAASSPETSVDAPSDATVTPESAAPSDGGPPEATADTSDASEAREGGACTPPPGCISEAMTCGSSCGQDFDACAQVCDAQTCVTSCRTPEQSCLGRCISACITCTTDGGCPASNACLAAAQP